MYDQWNFPLNRVMWNEMVVGDGKATTRCGSPPREIWINGTPGLCPGPVSIYMCAHMHTVADNCFQTFNHPQAPPTISLKWLTPATFLAYADSSGQINKPLSLSSRASISICHPAAYANTCHRVNGVSLMQHNSPSGRLLAGSLRKVPPCSSLQLAGNNVSIINDSVSRKSGSCPKPGTWKNQGNYSAKIYRSRSEGGKTNIPSHTQSSVPSST